MKNILILTLMAIMAISCNTTKHLSRSSEIVAIDSSELAHQSDSVAISKKEKTSETFANLNVNEDLEFEIKIYDTTKPVDSTTGKPPLKQEIITKKKKQTSAQNKQAARTIQSDSIAISKTETIKHKKEIQHKGREDIEQKTKFIFPWWGIIGGLIFAGILIIIAKLWKLKFWRGQ